MSKNEGKSRKPLIIGLIAVVVVLAVALTLVLTMCSGPQDPPADDTSNVGMEYTLFWNVDRELFTGNSQQGTGMTTREPDPDTGYYHVLFATNGRQVQRRVAERRVVNKIDSLDLMGLVFDEKGIITDVLDVEEITGGYAVNRFYVETVDGLNVVVNSSNSLKGMQEELTLTENTKIYDMSGESDYIGAQTGALYEMDCIIAVKNTAGEITDVFVAEREPQGPTQTKYCDHCKQEVNWKAWAYTNGLPLSSGHFYLTSDIELVNQNSMPENCQVILDLNGKTVVGGKGMRMYSLHNSGCYLAMMDYSAEQTGKFVPMGDISDQGAAVWLRFGQFDFYGGTLDGSQSVNHLNGGVVALEEGTLFNMYGGTITGGTDAAMSRANGSTVGGWGGNVYVFNGTFNMYGGVIKDGKATGVVRGEDGIFVGGYAGNVGVDGAKAVFHMYGGEILNGKAEQGGGNLWKDSATVTIDDGLISGGKITMEYQNGGNLFLGSIGTVTINGGKIVNGESYNVGANVYIGGDGELIINGGLIDGGKMLEYGTEKVLVGDSENIFCVNSNIVFNGGTVTGDINVLDYQGGTSTVTLSGNPVINGSADGSNNLKIPDGHRLILGVLTEGANISVTATGIFTQETIEANAKYFHVDNNKDVKVGYYNKCLTVGEVLMHCVCGSTDGKHVGECDGKTQVWMPTSSVSSMMEGGYWYLTGDVGVEEGSTFNMQHAVDNGQKVYIDLNGHTIQNNACGENRMFRVMSNKDGLLVITDSSKAKTGKLVSNTVDGDQGLLLWVPTGTVQIYNITLDASKATSLMDGAAISVEGGKLQMWNATILGGTTTGNAYPQVMKDTNGELYTMYLERGGAGGAIAAKAGTVELTGCTIKGGTAVGAYVTGLGKEGENKGTAGINGRGGALFIDDAVVTMNNCSVSDGIVKTESYYDGFKTASGEEIKTSWVYGGNIYVTGNGTLNMTDCTVSGGISGGTDKVVSDVKVDENGVLVEGCEPVLQNIGRGGNIWSMGTIHATNCTITGGRANQQGGNLSIENGKVTLILCTVTKGDSLDSGDLMDIRNDVDVTIQGGYYALADHTASDPGHDAFFIAPGTITLSSYTAADGTVTPLVFEGNMELHAYAATGKVILDGQVTITKLSIPTNRVITIGDNFDEANSNVCISLENANDYTSFIGVGAKEGDEKGFTTTMDGEAGLCRDNNGNLWFGKYSCVCGKIHENGAVIDGCDGTAHIWLPINSLSQIKADGYYYLTEDVTLDDQWGIDYNLNLSLNGHNISLVNENTTDTATHRLLHLFGSASVTITNWTNTEGGKLINHSGFNNSEEGDSGAVLFLRENAVVKLYNVILDATDAAGVVNGGALFLGSNNEAELYGCSILGEGSTVFTSGTLYGKDISISGTVYTNGQTTLTNVSGSGDVVVTAGKTTVKNAALAGQIRVSGGEATLNDIAITGEVSISGGGATISDALVTGTVDVTGGQLTLDNKIVISAESGKPGLVVSAGNEITLATTFDYAGSDVRVQAAGSFANGAKENASGKYGFSSVYGADVPVIYADGKLYLGQIVTACLCGETHDNANPNCNGEQLTWMAWTFTDRLPSSGNWYLVSDVTVNDQTGVNNDTLNLSLNGHNISTGTENCRVYQAQNGAVINLTNWGKTQGGVLRSTHDYLENSGGVLLIHNIAGTTGSAPVVTLTGVTVSAEGTSIGGGYGGAISLGADCRLSIYNSTIIGADTAKGTAIYSSGHLHLNNTTVTGQVSIEKGTVYLKNTVKVTDLLLPSGVSVDASELTASGSSIGVSATADALANEQINNIVVAWDVPSDVLSAFHCNVSGYKVTWEDANADGVGNIYLRPVGVIISCVCGQQAHVGQCNGAQVAWYPISNLNGLVPGGYYYFTDDIRIDGQYAQDFSLNLSLNGKNLIFEGGNDATSHRLLHIFGNAVWNITNWDKTEGGKLVNNVGFDNSADGDIGAVLFLRDTAGVNLYNVTLDATGAQNVSSGSAMYLGGSNSANLYNCALIGTATLDGNANLTDVSSAGTVTIVGGTVTLEAGTYSQVVVNGGAVALKSKGTTAIQVDHLVVNNITNLQGRVQIGKLEKSDYNNINILYLDYDNSSITVSAYSEFAVWVQETDLSKIRACFHTASGIEGDIVLYQGSLWVAKIHCECGATDSGTCAICGKDAVIWHPTDSITEGHKGGYYYLINDVEMTNMIRLYGGETLYLDLNGHTVTRSEAMRSSNTRMFDIFGSGGTDDNVLVVTDSSAEHKGKLDALSSSGGDQGMIFWVAEGALRVYNVTLDASGVTGLTDFGSAISTNAFDTYNGADVLLWNITVNGGTSDRNGSAIFIHEWTDSFTMIGCTVNGNTAGTTSDIDVGMDITVTDCTINATITGSGAVTVNSAAQLQEAYEAGATNIKLTDDVVLTQTLPITHDLTLDLGGKNISAAASLSGPMFSVEHKALTLKNGVITTGASVTSMISTEYSSSVNLDGVTLVAATADNKANLTIGIAISANGTAVNMTNSVIDASLNNTASDVNDHFGTAVYLNFNNGASSLVMNGNGQILGGWAKNASAVVSVFSPITLNDTSMISGGQSNYRGGNVRIDGHEALGDATITLNGSSKIVSGHTAQFGGNIWMNSNCHIVLNDNGEISGGAADWSAGGDEICVHGIDNTLTINSANAVIETDADSLVVENNGLTITNNAQ